MKTEKTLRWGILGCARITRRGLVPGIRASATGVLQALASRDPATARAWAAEFGVPRAHASYEAMLEDPEVDAVYIPLPNELHRPWVTAAADAGKHVLCEKPLALDAREAAAMVDHCRARGVLLMEAFMWRHQPRTLELRRLIRDGAIGELRLIRSSFSFPIAPGRLAARPGAGRRGALGRRLLRGEHRPPLRRRRTRRGPFRRTQRADGRQPDPHGAPGIPRRRAGDGRLQLRAAVPMHL